jgi:hypothetical protein
LWRITPRKSGSSPGSGPRTRRERRSPSGSILERDAPIPPASPKSFGQVAQEYLDYKRVKGKKSLQGDETFIARFAVFFGGDAPITEVTAQQIA